jgi:predicted metalloprotease
MRWKDGRRSGNIEDRRGVSAGPLFAGGMVLRLIPALIRSKVGRWVLVLGVVIFFGARMLGVDLMPFLTGGQTGSGTTQSQSFSAEEQELADFVSVVLADTEDTWETVFQSLGRVYEHPGLVLFTDRVQSACGSAHAAMGPFYCPGDRKVYIDLSFYHDLKTRHGAPGDFAQAYVIAHEVGHHVQTLLGISDKVHAELSKASAREANQLSVRQELQADCFAGIWGYHAHTQRQLLDSGDLEEALAAAAAIGDDRLQKQSQGTVTPDSFTHGSSAQRVRWFKQGFKSGKINACDTFNTDAL